MAEPLTLQALCALYLRPAVLSGGDTVVSGTVAFETPLTGPEQATFADLQTMAQFGLANNLTLTEFQSIKGDLATARAFIGIASPTAAQSNAALKATIRVLGALLRS